MHIEGEFVWHKHDDTDELFLLIEGVATQVAERYDLQDPLAVSRCSCSVPMTIAMRHSNRIDSLSESRTSKMYSTLFIAKLSWRNLRCESLSCSGVLWRAICRTCLRLTFSDAS